VTITIDISKEAEEKLKERARKTGKELPKFVGDLVEREARHPDLEELLAPIHEQTRRLGLSEQEIEELVDTEVAAYRRENPLRCRR